MLQSVYIVARHDLVTPFLCLSTCERLPLISWLQKKVYHLSYSDINMETSAEIQMGEWQAWICTRAIFKLQKYKVPPFFIPGKKCASLLVLPLSVLLHNI